MHGSCSCSCDHGVAGERVTVEFIASQLWPQNLPYLNPILYSIWGILWEKVYQTCIVDFGELKCRLNLEWTRLDHASNAGILCQWHCSVSACIKASSGHFEFCFRLKHFVVVVDEWNSCTLTSLCYLAFCPFWRYSEHFISQGKNQHWLDEVDIVCVIFILLLAKMYSCIVSKILLVHFLLDMV